MHVDGHSDFFTDENYPPERPFLAAAGMDLALATGRGESVLTAWPGVTGPLVDDADAIQLGERYEGAYAGLSDTRIELIPIRALQAVGIPAVTERTIAHLRALNLTRAWLHIDLDVLDEKAMHAVDSPGTPGLTYPELTALARSLLRSHRIAGLDVVLYDPDRDPDQSAAHDIVSCVREILSETRT